MKEKNNQIIWEPQELIYDVGDASNEAFLVIQGFVYLYTQNGLLLGRVGEGEVFGETSCILQTNRSVKALAGEHQVLATKIPHFSLKRMVRGDKALSAILRKTQLRLIDSNKQSQDLASDLDSILKKLENKSLNINNIQDHLKLIRKKLASMQIID
jgi:CRP-like cAMP-binding protein|tara:strand:- start:2358 stop:2825 length:468 start_codon:yes stop_codon:yes gene_type:complete